MTGHSGKWQLGYPKEGWQQRGFGFPLDDVHDTKEEGTCPYLKLEVKDSQGREALKLVYERTLRADHALIGMYRKELDYNWPEVRREMRRALDLNPSSPTVRLRNVRSGLMPVGLLEESVEELQIVIEADPLSLFNRWRLALMYYLARDNGRAMEQVRHMIDLDADYYLGHWMHGLLCMAGGLHGRAVEEFRRAAELSGNVPLILGWLGVALAQAGNSGEARSLLDRLSEIARAAYVPPSSFAWIHLGLGSLDEAFTWMDRAIDARDPMMIPPPTVGCIKVTAREGPGHQGSLAKKDEMTGEHVSRVGRVLNLRHTTQKIWHRRPIRPVRLRLACAREVREPVRPAARLSILAAIAGRTGAPWV